MRFLRGAGWTTCQDGAPWAHMAGPQVLSGGTSRAAAAAAAAAAAPAPPMTEVEAERLAAEERLTLVRSTDNATGWKGVSRIGTSNRPFVAQRHRPGSAKHYTLGPFATAAEAALAYARKLGPAGCAAAVAPPAAAAEPMTVAEARRLAAEEGLVLVSADNSTGFKGVYISHLGSRSTPFQATIRQGGKQRSLGTFASAAEAALACARHLGPAGCTAAAAPPGPPMTEELEGYKLEKKDNKAGYRWVARKGKRWSATIIQGATTQHLGCFDTPQLAALAIAKRRAAGAEEEQEEEQAMEEEEEQQQQQQQQQQEQEEEEEGLQLVILDAVPVSGKRARGL